jgi:DNA-binding SARP family transcriptional activator/predicted ATPase
MGHLAIFALGPLRIELDGKPLKTSRHKALALLVYLAMHPGKQSREALSALLWPDYEQEKAYAYLRRTLWEVRTLLGEGWLEADHEEIGFSPNAGILQDIAEFKSHLAAFNQHAHPTSTACQECITHLNKAALLYRGDFLAGFNLRDSANFEDWQFFQGEALRREYGEVLQKLSILLSQADSFMEAILFAQRWLALDTLNEEAHRTLMKTYARSGQRHAALRQYLECKRILQSELEVAPELTTSALYDSIISGKWNQGDKIPSKPIENREQNASGAGSTVIGFREGFLAKETQPRSNLPAPSTPFIGRQHEIDQIARLLREPDCWLLTLLGPGGIGKTRLAIEIGRKQGNNFPQGVFLIPMNMLGNEQSIAPAIAHILGLTFRQNGPAPGEQLIDFLREKNLLLILDALEGLVPWAGLLEQIHSHAASIKMLVTSRHRLQLHGEWVMEVTGLDYPPKRTGNAVEMKSDANSTYSAVELFLHAARRAQVTFQPTPEDFNAISQISQLLEGMPLGLELAATWVNTLSCQEIAAEISRCAEINRGAEKNQGLDFLEIASGDLSERQRSMRAVFDHSWNLMSAREQYLMPRLSVFRRSFTRQAAEQIAGISLRELSGLVDKSLLRRTPQGQFDIHDLLRQYYDEKLVQSPRDSQETRHRHCAYYCSRMMEWNQQVSGEKQGQVLREIEATLENVQAAWDWAVSQKQVDYLEQAVDALGMFYLRRARFTEGLEACQKAFAAIRGSVIPENHIQRIRLSARLLTWQAILNLNLENFKEASLFLRESQRLLDDSELDCQQSPQEWIFLLGVHALLANQQNDYEGTVRFTKQATQLSLEATGKTPSFLVFFWRFLMGGAVSRELYMQMEQNLAHVQRGGDPFEIGCYLFVLGIAELYHAYRMDKAEPMLLESCQHFQRVDDPSTQVMIYMTLGYLLLAQGKFEECLVLKQQELEIYQDIGDRRMIGIALAEIGEVLCHLGKYPESEDHIRKGMALVKDRSDYEFSLRHRYLGDALLAQGKHTEAREAYQFSYQFFQANRHKGWTLTALAGLSRVELAFGDRRAAWEHAQQALNIHADIQLFTFFAYLPVAQMALLLIDQGEIVRALELYTLVVQQGYLAKSNWFADLYGRSIEAAIAKLPFDEQAAAQARAKTLNIFTLAYSP